MATQPNYRGALTHYLCHPESFTYKLPDNMDTMEGALVEPAAVGMHAAMLADVKPGKKIIILGAGCIGLMTLQACKCLEQRKLPSLMCWKTSGNGGTAWCDSGY